MKRIIAHWSAGTYNVGRLEREHYHLIIDGDGKVHNGKHSISDNESTSDGVYAAHTRHCNTGSIGISVACMAGAKEGFRHGDYPMKEEQFESLCNSMAVLCGQHGIPVSSLTTLTHAEVQPNLGIKQNGKWDFTELSFNHQIVGARNCGDYMRERIKHYFGDAADDTRDVSVEDTQLFLNEQGAHPPLDEDGDWGPKSEAAWNAHRSKL
jgi:N-acetyl-anhydromuramyl-L-alanine amidase AmpD